MNAVTIPTGMPPSSTDLAMISQIRRNAPPAMADIGIRSLELDATSFLAMLGTIRPTNPMVPTKLTDRAVKRDMRIRQITRVLAELTPKEDARLSSMLDMSMSLDSHSIDAIITSTATIRRGAVSASTFDREPRVHLYIV